MDSQQININIDQDKIDAKFCDQVMMNTAAFGFTFDFIQQIPQMKTARVLSRIAMSPQHAKIFSELLANSVKHYEQNFGEIKLTAKMKEESQRRIGFRSESGQISPENGK